MSEPVEGAFSVKDNRRIDPITGEVRERDAAPAPPPAVAEIPAEVAELTADLQRLQAEYANYRKRVERDRDLTRQHAVTNTLAEFFPVLDDVERARSHGDLDGAFRSVGEALEGTVLRLGLKRFGVVGEKFDPRLHEAIAVEHVPEATSATLAAVHQMGYQFAERVVRPAVVTVAEPGQSDGPAIDEVVVD